MSKISIILIGFAVENEFFLGHVFVAGRKSSLIQITVPPTPSLVQDDFVALFFLDGI